MRAGLVQWEFEQRIRFAAVPLMSRSASSQLRFAHQS